MVLDKIGHVGLNNLLAAYTDKSAYAQVMSSHSFVTNKIPLNSHTQRGHVRIHGLTGIQGCKVFVGKTDGNIVSARGPTTFGWDPVFEPKRVMEKRAEMPKKEKNKNPMLARWKSFVVDGTQKETKCVFNQTHPPSSSFSQHLSCQLKVLSP